MTDNEELFGESYITDDAEVIVSAYSDGTGSLEIAEYGKSLDAPTPGPDAQTIMTAHQMRVLARLLLAAAETLDDN
jgi:hypothetical protein